MPTWLLVSLGIAILLAFEVLRTGMWPELQLLRYRSHLFTIWPAFLPLVIVPILVHLCWPRPAVDAPQKEHEPKDSQPDSEDDRLLAWVSSDNPVEDRTKGDYFQNAPIADRVTEALKDNQNTALLGRFGSGKTTVIRWAKAELSESQDHRYVFANVDAWGRRESEFAGYLLARILRALRQEIDVLPVLHVDKDFVEAFSGSSRLAKLIHLCQRGRSPHETLQRLDRLLRWHRIKLVCVVEDVDRNRDEEFVKDKLPAVLDRLAETENILFVLAINVDSSCNPWLYRISERIQELPEAEPRFVLKTIERFRDFMRVKHEVISPVDTILLARMLAQYGSSTKGSWYRALLEDRDPGQLSEADSHTPAGALARLLANPRTCKTVLRRTLQAWDRLPGEALLDEILVINAMRYAFPELHQFVAANVSFLQKFRGAAGRKSEDDPLKHLRQKFAEMFDAVKNPPVSSEEAGILIDYLFSGWLTDQYKRLGLQTVAISDPTDYWVRIAKEQSSEDEVRDQVVLAALSEFQTSEKNGEELAKSIVGRIAYADKLQQFGKAILDAKHTHSLASMIFTEILSVHGVRSNNEIPGFKQVKSLLEEPEVLSVPKEFGKALKVSLRFSFDILHYLKSFSVPKMSHTEIYQSCISMAEELWCGEKGADLIAKTMDPECPHSLHDLLVLIPHDNAALSQTLRSEHDPCVVGRGDDQHVFFPSLFASLADPLVAAAHKYPQRVLLQIANILLDFDERSYLHYLEPRGEEPSSRFNEEAGELWFGERFTELMRLFADQGPSDYPDLFQLRMTLMKRHAAEYLESKEAEATNPDAEAVEPSSAPDDSDDQ